MIDLFVVNAVLDIVLLPSTIYGIWKCFHLLNEAYSCALQEEKQQVERKNANNVFSCNIIHGTLYIDYDDKYITIKQPNIIINIEFDRIIGIYHDTDKICDSIIETFCIWYDDSVDNSCWSEDDITKYYVALLPETTESPIENKKRRTTNNEIRKRLYELKRMKYDDEEYKEPYKSKDVKDYNFALNVSTTPLQTKTSR